MAPSQCAWYVAYTPSNSASHFYLLIIRKVYSNVHSKQRMEDMVDYNIIVSFLTSRCPVMTLHPVT